MNNMNNTTAVIRIEVVGREKTVMYYEGIKHILGLEPVADAVPDPSKATHITIPEGEDEHYLFRVGRELLVRLGGQLRHNKLRSPDESEHPFKRTIIKTLAGVPARASMGTVTMSLIRIDCQDYLNPTATVLVTDHFVYTVPAEGIELFAPIPGGFKS